MDKIKSILKQNLKLSTALLAGIILCGGSVYATILLSSSEVSYNNNGQATVEGALDELYTLANTAVSKECQDGYTKVVVGSDRYTCVDYRNVNFATSSWSEIIEAYNAGVTTQLQADMEAGVTRDITLGGGLGTHPVRIANLTPCSTANTVSQSACGLVIEFADIITNHQMNPYTDGTTNGDGNKGGWEYSDMRAYVNSTTYTAGNINYSSTGIYSNMPSDLKPLIISTSVVSGHGSNDSSNFTTDDYMYLLSMREVWNYQDVWDTASETDSVTNKAYTRQLDYYNTKGVTTSSYSAAIKQRNGSNSYWWLRSAGSNVNNNFYIVYSDGYYYLYGSNSSTGVSPAFRLSSGVTPPSFATSSWSDIVAGYNAGETSQLEQDMANGVTRDITLGGDFGTHPVRIANLTPCSTANTVSQSACGLVIEFADRVSDHTMNLEDCGYDLDCSNGEGNKGGWEYSDMRAFVNSTIHAASSTDYSTTGIYSNMPGDLKDLIISTSVVSGHGVFDSDNFTTDDYMYLLSMREVYNYQGRFDTASETDSVTNKAYTRQLDYYNIKGVTTDSYSAAAKQQNGINGYWWLRTAYPYSENSFKVVASLGDNSDYTYDDDFSASPAFRLAN